MFYILDNNFRVIETKDVVRWSKLINDVNERRVKESIIGEYYISTVFLGVNHSFIGKDLFFETMVFKANGEDVYTERYTTWEEAEEGHDKVVNCFR